MKGFFAVLLLGSVSAIPFRNYGSNSYGHGKHTSKYFMREQQPLSYGYMSQPMGAVPVSQPMPYHFEKMVGENYFKHEGGDHGNHHGNHHGSHHGKEEDDNEQLPYTVVEDYGPYELREYPSTKFACVKAEVDTAEDPFAGLKNVNPFTIMGSKRWRKTPNSFMFKALFKYISGVNKEGKEIEMTTPVSTHHKILKEGKGGDLEVQEMCFYVPAEHQAYPPTPLDSSPVYVHTRPAMRVYTLRFGGHTMSSDDWNQQRDILEVLLIGKAHHQDEYFTNGYDSPMKFHNRRNEVWVEDTSFVAPDVSDERVVDAGKNEEAVAEPEHVMEEDLSLQVEDQE